MALMVFLADFSVIKPDPGLIVWTSVIFLLVWVILGRTAFRPIQTALKKRDQDIQTALDEAKHAREEIGKMQSQNEQLLKQASEERAQILKEAKDAKESIIREARETAKEEAQKIVNAAKVDVDHMRLEVLTSIKNDLGEMALDIAEKLVRNDLKGNTEQVDLSRKLVNEIKFN
jgi:F-type H+-transporting ATPase subunit b